MESEPKTTEWSHSSPKEFFDYYSKASLSEKTRRRFLSIRDTILRVHQETHSGNGVLEIADIGCGAGSQSLLWAELGHHVNGLDVNKDLIDLGKERAAQSGYKIDFRVGSATDLPWGDHTMDVCLIPELLEHVADWQTCLSECARIVKPGGILYLTTSNKLCPKQQEFNLPCYSWYPAVVKRYCEHLAVTSKPQLANYAQYPAVNWFSFYSLRAMLEAYGFRCLDRFDVMDLSNKSALQKFIVLSMRKMSILRWLGHVVTEGTIVLATKRQQS